MLKTVFPLASLMLFVAVAEACPPGSSWYLEYFPQQTSETKAQRRYVKPDCETKLKDTPIQCRVSEIAKYKSSKNSGSPENVESVTLSCKAENYQFMAVGSYYPQRGASKLKNSVLYLSYQEDEDYDEDKITYLLDLSCFPKPKSSLIDRCEKKQEESFFPR